VSSLAKDNKFRFNDQKSKVMLKKKKKKRKKRLGNIFKQQNFRQVKTMKYLGIIIDNKLTFREHITQVTDKYRKLILV
jgi:hypothetical protein